MKYVAKYYYLLVNAMLSCNYNILRLHQLQTQVMAYLYLRVVVGCVFLLHLLVVQLSSLPFHSDTFILKNHSNLVHRYFPVGSSNNLIQGRCAEGGCEGHGSFFFYEYLHSLLPSYRGNGWCPSTSPRGIVPFGRRIDKIITLELSFFH